jgi:hypothetical protein
MNKADAERDTTQQIDRYKVTFSVDFSIESVSNLLTTFETNLSYFQSASS